MYVWHKGSERETLWIWIAWKLPRRLVYWCTMRLGANATQGKYNTTNPSELTFMDAIKRWE
jgi:hypothetical protein